MLLTGSLGGEPKVHGHFAPRLARLNTRQVKSLRLRQAGEHCGVMWQRQMSPAIIYGGCRDFPTSNGECPSMKNIGND